MLNLFTYGKIFVAVTSPNICYSGNHYITILNLGTEVKSSKHMTSIFWWLIYIRRNSELPYDFSGRTLLIVSVFTLLPEIILLGLLPLPLQLIFFQCQTLWFIKETIFLMTPNICPGWFIAHERYSVLIYSLQLQDLLSHHVLEKRTLIPPLIPDWVTRPSVPLKSSAHLLGSGTALTSPYPDLPTLYSTWCSRLWTSFFF